MRNMINMNKKQSGFTLIELIMVIVILGILSAFALPRFADLGADARKATVQGAFGAIKSASAISHSSWLAGGDNAATSIDLEGVTVNITNGYPSGTATAGIGDAAQLVAADYALDDSTTVGTVTVTANGVTAANAANCRATYVQAAANASPTISIDVSNCN